VIHYHGTPITPQAKLLELAGRNFCVSYAAPYQVAACHEIGQSVMLDNGAFSFWKSRRPTDWQGFADWARPWLEYPTTWAVMPDVIDGDEQDNHALITWLYAHARDVWERSAPVWHMHESLDRLERLCGAYKRVCIGSSGQYASVGSDSWRRRMEAAMNAVCGNGPVPVWLHMLRGMGLSGSEFPFASVDSTDIAQNHNGGAHGKKRNPRDMADRWDGIQNPCRWQIHEQLEMQVA
jgi:hypothetical protein